MSTGSISGIPGGFLFVVPPFGHVGINDGGGSGGLRAGGGVVAVIAVAVAGGRGVVGASGGVDGD